MNRDKFPYRPLRSENQVDLLRGDFESDNPRSMYYEIRKQLRYTLLNGDAISRLPKQQRKQIFETVPDTTTGNLSKDVENLSKYVTDKFPNLARFEGLEVEENDQGELVVGEVPRLRNSLIGWLAFLYAGIDEANSIWLASPYKDEDSEALGGPGEEGWVPVFEGEGPSIDFDFGSLLREAVARIAHQRGEQVTDFEFSVETETIKSRSFDTEELLERFEEGGLLDTGEHLHLRREADLTPEEWEAYWERVDSRIEGRQGGGGFMSGGEAVEMMERAREEAQADDEPDE